jgi:hypothetical protein
MPIRATKRGAERTPLDTDADVVICGASFAGLAVARELAGTRARVLIVDRYEVGEKQTSACAAPTEWLTNLGLGDAIEQTFGRLLVHSTRGSRTWPLPWTFSTFDYRKLCALLFDQRGDAEFETAKVNGRTGTTVHTDRGDLRGAADRRRARLAPRARRRHERAAARRVPVARPRGPPARALRGARAVARPEVRPARLLVVVPRGRRGPRRRRLVRPALPRQGPDAAARRRRRRPAEGFQGNWIPHKLRKAVDDEIFFAGDSAGHCLPVTAEGIRTAALLRPRGRARAA